MLLLLLLSLATVSHVSATRTYFTTSVAANVSACPITFYGRVYKTLYANLTDSNITICFKGPYRPGSKNDCILLPKGAVTRGYLGTTQRTYRPGSHYHRGLPQLTGSTTCYVYVGTLNGNSQAGIFNFAQFGEQGALAARLYSAWSSSPVEAVVQVDGVKLDDWNMAISRLITKDISGCRHSGALFLPKTGKCESEDFSVTCSASAVLSTTPCGSGEICQGDGQCVLDATCTVTGSTVIDLGGQVVSVPDRCAYTLMSESGVHLQAVFQDRRRKDVSFLDHVILHLDDPGVNFHLGQGGRVQLNDTKLSLSSTPVEHHGVQLSKDQTGVTAKLVHSNYNTSIFFDGYTAQIHMTGPSGNTLQGLCGNSSRSLSDMKVSAYSSSSCEKQYKEVPDSQINCKTVTERCNLLKEDPFTSCHNRTNPEPFITACTNTLCKYPAVDGLNCQFLEAYARACSLQSKDTLEDWRSKASCPSPRAFCQDKFCSAHEFCAEDISGGTSCYCRAIFGSKYRSTNTFGEPTVCNQSSASLTLVGCLLEEKSIDYSVLHLNDPNCRGQRDSKTHMVTFSFDSSNVCGTVVKANSSKIMYKNAIMTWNSSGPITRRDQVNIDFSCFYNQPDIKTLAFKIKDSSVIQQIVSGAWNYTLTMKAYTDADRTQAVESSTEIQLEQTIWVELKTDGLDDKLVAVVTDSCWATNEASSSGSLRYDLIIKGCSNPADQTVKVQANGLGTSNYFSFNMFQFSGKSGDVYLHCKLNLCVKKKNSTCAPSCSGGKRGRRSARTTYEDVNPAFITMAWTN
ncbi:alpha-tectorin-like [Thunnus thynnus]|uniref:alpha-tectorin-like n=1 Tax=Thunnus thynnus TaxID=8237 RepID=UPI00352728F6